MMAATPQPVWYVRKNGWVQGPFTADLMRRMYEMSWLGAVDRVASRPNGPWSALRDFPELLNEGGTDSATQPREGWEIASPLLPSQTPIELGMLQMFAAAGRLRQNDLVRKLPDGEWQPARLVEGVFGGRRSWCTACSSPLGNDRKTCSACGAVQPDYEPSLATIALVCGLVAFAWDVLALLTITTLAVRRSTVFGFAMEESFPQAFLLMLVTPLWLAIVAVTLGHSALRAVRSGRSRPADSGSATIGMILGWVTLGLLLLTGVGVVAFSLPYFRVVT
jgi:hypothetical protein